MKKLCLTIIVFIIACGNAYALRVIKYDGVYVYYPVGEDALATSLMSRVPTYERFLDEFGFKIPKPLHVIIDEKRDYPSVLVHIIPHYEIRIPIKAPGVFDEGYLEEDPWGYFLFKGMCLQGVYRVRSGLPNALSYVFGEVMSPNGIMAPWFDEGFSSLMFRIYKGTDVQDPYERAIFRASIPLDVAKLSNHPGIWPGHYAYRIFGRPFIEWVHERYGMDKLIEFIKEHGAGIIPLEIDIKAKDVFGKTWHDMWLEYMSGFNPSLENTEALFVTGYWPEPFIYWNFFGVHPGVERTNACGRYGYHTQQGILWINEYDYDGSSHLVSHRGSITNKTEIKHVWDPGAGNIAVTRKGSLPYLVDLETESFLGIKTLRKGVNYTPGPLGAIQMSGPVRNQDGRVAVAANVKGNWDIWVYDSGWKRITALPSIEIDPWWDGDKIVYSSNASGIFQIYQEGMIQLSKVEGAGIMPRNGMFLDLVHSGWKLSAYEFKPEDSPVTVPLPEEKIEARQLEIMEGKGYNPLNSLFPNWMIPDMYADTSDVQLGLVTFSRDVSTDYTLNAGFRYSFSEDYLSGRLGGSAKGFGLNMSRYPLDYSSDKSRVEESRFESKVSYRPLEDFKWFEVSFNWLNWKDRRYGDVSGEDIWGAISLNKVFGSLSASLTCEHYSGGMNSLYGGLRFRAGKEIFGVLSVNAGKTWGDYEPGHGSFRMGGDVGEGYFTRRPSRLYPLRGFQSNALEAGQVYTAGGEIYWPIANLQKGYGTLPLFLHRLKIGTFVDSGICSDKVSREDFSLGAGLELVTSLEFAWGVMSEIRFGMGWPLVVPDYIDAPGYVFLFQIGRPL